MSNTAERPIASIADPVPDSERQPPPATVRQAGDEDLVVEDLLVEDVSIDGMCGVY